MNSFLFSSSLHRASLANYDEIIAEGHFAISSLNSVVLSLGIRNAYHFIITSPSRCLPPPVTPSRKKVSYS